MKGEHWETKNVIEGSHCTCRESNLRKKERKKKQPNSRTAYGRKEIMFQSIKHFLSAKQPPLSSEHLEVETNQRAQRQNKLIKQIAQEIDNRKKGGVASKLPTGYLQVIVWKTLYPLFKRTN